MKKLLIRGLVLLAVVALVIGARHYVLGVRPHARNEAQHVALISPRPEPPRRAPEPEQKPKEETAEPEPQPNLSSEFHKFDDYAPSDAPPSPGDGPGGLHDDLLGVDATGRGGPDAFGLVGKHGGRDVTTLGNATVGPATGGGGSGHGTGGPMAKFAAYGLMVRDFLTTELNKHTDLRVANYEVVVTLVITHDGRIMKAGIEKSTGVAKMDEAIRAALVAAPPMAMFPPTDLPQPVHVRISSEGSSQPLRAEAMH